MNTQLLFLVLLGFPIIGQAWCENNADCPPGYYCSIHSVYVGNYCQRIYTDRQESRTNQQLNIHCDKGTGYAETRTSQGGTLHSFYPTIGPFTARVRSNQIFIWGYATGGGENGGYVALGAAVTLMNQNQISLTQQTTEIAPEGTIRFTTSKGHSINYNLELESSDLIDGGYCMTNDDCILHEWCIFNKCKGDKPGSCGGVGRYCAFGSKNCCSGLECVPSGSDYIGAHKCQVLKP